MPQLNLNVMVTELSGVLGISRLAEALGVTNRTVSNWIAGPEPKSWHAEKIKVLYFKHILAKGLIASYYGLARYHGLDPDGDILPAILLEVGRRSSKCRQCLNSINKHKSSSFNRRDCGLELDSGECEPRPIPEEVLE